MKKVRAKRGAAIALGVVLAFVLMILGIGFVWMSMYFGGQSETKNAVDAGTLNVGKESIDNVNVNIGPGKNERCFFDVTNDDTNQFGDTKVNLRRINRVWAKAMLMAINADAAQKAGQAGSGPSNAEDAVKGAKAISDRLADKLTNQNNLHGFFDAYSERNSVRMITTKKAVKHVAGNNWQTSLLEREKESNIVLTGGPNGNFNLPPDFPGLKGDYWTQTTRNPAPNGSSGKFFLTGYTPLEVGDNTCWQVPFLFDEKPHLVAKSTFDANKKNAKAIDWDKPVPNAFSAAGNVVDAGPRGQSAMSWVLSNPRKPFKMCMPGSYMHIHVDDNKAHWYFFPTGYPPIEFMSTDYGYTTETKTISMPGGGVLCATVTATSVLHGTDVVGRNLDQIIFGIPAGSTGKLEKEMTARCNEMISKVGVVISKDDMHDCLGNPLTIGMLIAGVRDFYVYSSDGETLVCRPEQIAKVELAAKFGITSFDEADGTEKKLIDEADSFAPIFNIPTVVPDPFCSPFLQLGWGKWYKDVAWRPGTGYNGNLGDVRVKRWTNIYSLGACNPL